MKQYSMLWGTAADGEYHYLWSNPELPVFLGSLGAPDRNLAANTTQRILRAFKRYPDYQYQPTDDMPVSVHYAPMHLYKLPDFPVTMKPFVALSFTGDENRIGGRDSTYSHTIVMSVEMVRGKDPEYNFLDFMFGTQLTTWQQVEAFREKWSDFQPDHPPMKVEPVFRDLDTAVYAASILIDSKGEKNIILRLEKGCGFNRRACELLKQIYSLLPPRLATETGFATYHPVENIDELSNRNSVQVFVLPAEADVSVINRNKSIILDLSDRDYDPPSVENPLTEVLLSWSKMSWSRRYVAYKSLFAGEEIDYQNSNTFVERSIPFLKSVQELDNWLESEESAESVSSLRDLEKLFADHPAWTKIPWAKESIKEAMPDLLADGVNLPDLLANSIATCRFTEDAEEMHKEFSRFHLGSLFAEANARMICNLVAEKQKAVTKAEDKLVFDEQEAKYVTALSAKDNEIARQQVAHTQERQKLCECHAAELQNITAAYAEMEQRLTGEVNSIKTEKLSLENKLHESNEKNLALQAMLRKKEAALADASNEIERLRIIERNAATASRRVQEVHKTTKEVYQKPQEDLKKAEHHSGASDGRPRFLRNIPWWMPMIAMLLAGALLVGAPWLILSLTGGSSEPEEPFVTVEPTDTTKPTQATTAIPTETKPVTEPTAEATTVPTEPEPVEFMGWDDPALAEHMLISVDGVEQVAADDSWYADDIAIPEGYTVMAAVSSEEEGTFTGYPDSYALILSIAQVGEKETNIVDSEEDASNSGISNSESDTEPDETNTDGEYNSSTSDSEVDTEPTEEDNGWDNRNTESTTEATEEVVPVELLTTEEWFALSDRIQLVIETENQVILSVGTDKMHEVAFRTAAWSAANEYIDIHITVRLEDGDLLDLTEGVRPLLRTKYGGSYWWYVLEDFSTESSHMIQLQTILNTSRCPILSFKYLGNEIVAFDYQGDVDMAAKLEEDIDAKAVGDIVYALAPHSSNSTETSTEALDPTETSYNVGGMN